MSTNDENQASQEHSEWEEAFDGLMANNTLLRMRVPGGWLYRMEGSKELTFVPDA